MTSEVQLNNKFTMVLDLYVKGSSLRYIYILLIWLNELKS